MTGNRKLREKTGRFASGNDGRPRGAQNKLAREVKEMVLHALDEAGGVAYLVKCAHKNPAAFLALLGKVLPLTVNTPEGTVPMAVQFVVQPVRPAGDEAASQKGD